ncbi:MAG: NACHT domain-containing protein [Anaerolineae bacterium]
MADNPPGYDAGAIRELLLAAFTADELRRFCQDRAGFRQVLKDVGANPSPNELADQILTHCETHFLYDQLLAEVKQLAPRQYERFAPSLLLPEAVVAEVACPYRGLEFFDVEHAADYFGRQAMVGKLLDKVAGTDFVAVVGPSGCGKSSLVRAGLVPALRKGKLPGSRAWQIEFFKPGSQPLRALSMPLVTLLEPGLDRIDRMAKAQKLAGHLQSGAVDLDFVFSELSTSAPRFLLVADQFEEAFTHCDDEEVRQAFVKILLAAADRPWLTVILTLRADFAGHLLADARLGDR